ncbi:MAG: DUF4292 domain-containing protein [Bacteroidota bacterium]
MLITLILSSCSNARRLKNGKPLRNQNAGHILKEYDQNEFTYDWIGMKLAVEFNDGEQKRSFKATLRSKKDSIIWMSISPALGVEVARVMITPDSIQVISKIPGDKFYYAGSIDAISDMMQSDFDFNMIQNALVGNAIGLEQGEDKYKSKVDGQQYVLISKYNRMIKRVVGGIDEKDTAPDDSLEVDLKRNRYERLKRRADEEELLVKRYWFNGVSYRLERSIFDDLYYQRSVQIEHSDFKEYGVQSYPELTRLIINSLGQRQEIEVKINRLKTNKEYDFPFDIPEDFERRTKL